MSAPVGLWLLASLALGRPVPVDERYPHVCHITVASRMLAGRTVRLTARDCAACHHPAAGGAG